MIKFAPLNSIVILRWFRLVSALNRLSAFSSTYADSPRQTLPQLTSARYNSKIRLSYLGHLFGDYTDAAGNHYLSISHAVADKTTTNMANACPDSDLRDDALQPPTRSGIDSREQDGADLQTLDGEPASRQDVGVTLLPPKQVYGMTDLDRTVFKSRASVPSLLVEKGKIELMLDTFRRKLLKLPGIQPVANLATTDPCYHTHKLFLFDPRKRPSMESMSAEEQADLDLYKVDRSTWKLCQLDLTYENWTHAEVLRAVLPADSDTVNGFSQIGHIIHLNLKDQLLPYKHLIGEVLLDKVKTAQTVVNKTIPINNTFRNFQFEVLAGVSNMMTTVSENGCQFKMDFSKVYWNPRLETLHKVLIKELSRGDVLYDIFAGIGPFAIPCAKKRCHVFANDLNPESYRWLKENVELNKADVRTYNMDAWDFVREVVRADLAARWGRFEREYRVHVTMNLPGRALHFLPVFRGLLAGLPAGPEQRPVYPRVHLYCFSKEDDVTADVTSRAAAALGEALPEDAVIREVRRVAPNKAMVKVTFTLSRSVLCDAAQAQRPAEDQDQEGESEEQRQGAQDEALDTQLEPQEKRQKTAQ